MPKERRELHLGGSIGPPFLHSGTCLKGSTPSPSPFMGKSPVQYRDSSCGQDTSITHPWNHVSHARGRMGVGLWGQRNGPTFNTGVEAKQCHWRRMNTASYGESGRAGWPGWTLSLSAVQLIATRLGPGWWGSLENLCFCQLSEAISEGKGKVNDSELGPVSLPSLTWRLPRALFSARSFKVE